ncbi:2TM domain-containing protein [Rathayibacter sp. SD072]|uniref:2TM domain-containing protein n=1 Tax=Rathayibacter sp. SD072 TaxID=2781731 RepID=UPI001A96F9C1|nr:2TM domain-containing protein [Rathayibacter sp. SD072]MBO0983449.1 2TM domain-containing protein [Rathayibacter sp. SD072]
MSDEWGSPDPAARRDATGAAVEPASGSAAAVPEAARVEDADRALAVREIKRRRDFAGTVGGWASVSAITTTVWIAGGADGYFWPIWPMLGIGIGVVAQAAAIWGPMKKEITEDDIAAEMRKRELRGR